MPLWRGMLDYRHGTGHGVGCMLNVHEGPQSIRWKGSTDEAQRLAQEEPLCEGMLVSNEPGYYEPGGFGIRIENILLVKTVGESEYGSYMGFETLTYVPLEREAIDEDRLTREHQQLFNLYQEQVYERLRPFMTEEERQWLWEVTRPLGMKIE
jgi:Xaa-Pro aminopeptidase